MILLPPSPIPKFGWKRKIQNIVQSFLTRGSDTTSKNLKVGLGLYRVTSLTHFTSQGPIQKPLCQIFVPTFQYWDLGIRLTRNGVGVYRVSPCQMFSLAPVSKIGRKEKFNQSDSAILSNLTLYFVHIGTYCSQNKLGDPNIITHCTIVWYIKPVLRLWRCFDFESSLDPGHSVEIRSLETLFHPRMIFGSITTRTVTTTLQP